MCIRDRKLREATWPEALQLAKSKLQGGKVFGLAGDLASVESIFALKQLIVKLNGSFECRVDGAKLPNGFRSAYVGSAAIEDLDEAEHIMIVGSNPRDEAPVLNARIRKAWAGGANIELVGLATDPVSYTHLTLPTKA